jgi:hypothetical protein
LEKSRPEVGVGAGKFGFSGLGSRLGAISGVGALPMQARVVPLMNAARRISPPTRDRMRVISDFRIIFFMNFLLLDRILHQTYLRMGGGMGCSKTKDRPERRS